MEKNVLVLYYTQTGQLSEIVDSFTKPLQDAGITVEKALIKVKNNYPFPWTSDSFFNEMPESVLGIPAELLPFEFKRSSYDLVILAYQTWFLSPSIPTTSALKHPVVQQLLQNTPVVTLIGSRNMWLFGQEKVKKLLKEIGAKLVGNVALVDRHNNHLSAVSILYWMLSGKKERCWNIFPKPGISDEDIKNASAFGEITLKHLTSADWAGLQDTLVLNKAVEIKPNLMFIEQRAQKLFFVWANLIRKRKNRKPWVIGFKYYLLIALFIVAPIVVSINEVLFKPFLKKQINKKKKYYQGLI